MSTWITIMPREIAIKRFQERFGKMLRSSIVLIVLLACIQACIANEEWKQLHRKPQGQHSVVNAAAAARDINLGESDFQCPTGYVVYPDTQCNRYYTCYGGQPTYLMQCEADLLFDLTYYGCNWKEQVDCGDRVPPGQVTTTTQTPIGNFTCPEANGFFAAYPDYCDPNYIECLDWVPYPAKCPANGVFDPISKVCVSPDSPACTKYTTTPSTTTPPITTTTAAFQCPAEDGFYPISETTCSSNYYACLDGNAYLETCRGYSVFDPIEKICTTNSSFCGVITSPTASLTSTTSAVATPTTTKPSGTSAPFTCPSPNGNFADPNSCNQYYQCSNSNPNLFVCPAGLVFNPAIGTCDWPYNVPGCEGGSSDQAGSQQRNKFGGENARISVDKAAKI
ncbi:chitin-binding domain protein cbd-1-like isoform X2 [Daphnia pulicaria]|uniref:chitin-binding domain protein cbd-1-like isoform X2 n=1 Tax=Daphnia pulicaria TaxID=35523 RepID=UPI001EEB34BB|nr:chitin-binding domain protein cbd-1-like isoform X2 [Daphnia pulicaria]